MRLDLAARARGALERRRRRRRPRSRPAFADDPDRRRRARRDRAPRADHERLGRAPPTRSTRPSARAKISRRDGARSLDAHRRLAQGQGRRPAAAERALEEALKHDPQSDFILREIEVLQRSPGRERDLVATLRRLAALDGLQGAPAELRREAKALAENVLERRAARRGHPPRDDRRRRDRRLGARRADEGARGAGDFKEVFNLLVRQAELAADGAAIRDLRHAAAASRARSSATTRAPSISTARSSRTSRATRAPAPRSASSTPRARTTRICSQLLSRLIDLAESPDGAHRHSGSRAAAICLEKLDAVTEATEHLRAVLDEDAGNEKATLLLSQLLEKTGRDQELAELLDSQIELAAEQKDVSKELTFRVRLGEVYETRLNDVAKAIETYQAVIGAGREPQGRAALAGAALRAEGRQGRRGRGAREGTSAARAAKRP